MRCVQCEAEIVFGEPHKMWVTEGGVTREETYCQLCAEDYAWGFWPEDWGPYPHKISRNVGNA
jgi:hypothetical protein